ncbi:MAG: hypothetical protein EOO90_05305 [Pedobacter sp.]|nr:MAG: hypothetical protein EOO90_05305 [Pedobacter sp.]
MKKNLFILVLFMLVGQFAMAADGMIKPSFKKVISQNKFSSYQISIKKVEAPVELMVSPTSTTTKRNVNASPLRNLYAVSFEATCGFPITFYVSCYNCSAIELEDMIILEITDRNLDLCDQVPTFMLYQVRVM